MITVKNIPIHIGVHDLKSVAFLSLHPRFLKWSKGVAIQIDQVLLFDKDGAEMVPLPGVPDVDAIASKFFVVKGKGKQLQFRPGKGLECYLELPTETYEKINKGLVDREDSNDEEPASVLVSTIFLVPFES
jgi:hypothetical protein